MTALLEDIYLLVHKDVRAVPEVAAVVQGLVELFRREAALLAGRGGDYDSPAARTTGKRPVAHRVVEHGARTVDAALEQRIETVALDGLSQGNVLEVHGPSCELDFALVLVLALN